MAEHIAFILPRIRNMKQPRCLLALRHQVQHQSVNEHCGPSQSWYSLYATALTATLSCTWNASESMGGTAAPSSLSMEQAPDCLHATRWAVTTCIVENPQVSPVLQVQVTCVSWGDCR